MWYMQGTNAKARTLDYYPTVEEIFRELARQAGTKLSIPAREKEIDLLIEDSLTDQEKEEDYELNLYISTFVSEETPVEYTDRLQITIKPSTAKRTEPQIAKPKPQTQLQITPPAAESVVPTQELTSHAELENPEYAITKGIIRKLSKEIEIARKKIKTQEQQQGKGKCKLIISRIIRR